MALPSLLARLLGRAPAAAPAQPAADLAPRERSRLEHRRRRVQQALRQAERRLNAHDCGPACTTRDDPGGVALQRRTRALAAELARIEAALGTPGGR